MPAISSGRVGQQAVDALVHHFGNSAGAEGDHRHARGEGLQDHARGGLVCRRGHQQQVEIRQSAA